MTDGQADLSRRGFLTAAAGGTGVAAASGAAFAQENETDGNGTGGENETVGGEGISGGNASAADNETATGNETDGGDGGGGGGEPDLGGYLDDTSNFDGTIENMRGQSEVTVEVGVQGNDGPNAFGPPAIHVDNGTTVVWEWTGEGFHNVVHEGGNFESETTNEAGFTFDRAFDEDGIYKYYCQPHESNGMMGVVVVGTDYPTVAPEGDGSGPSYLPSSALTLGVASSFIMLATLGLSYFFIKYGGDYGDSEQ